MENTMDIQHVLDAISDFTANWPDDKDCLRDKMQGSKTTQRKLRDAIKPIVQAIDEVDFGHDIVRRGGHTLMCLGKIPYSTGYIGTVECTRSLYVGTDGNIYIEGPRPKRGQTVIDIHPYCADDARGWYGVSADNILEMLERCYV